MCGRELWQNMCLAQNAGRDLKNEGHASVSKQPWSGAYVT